MPKQKDLKRIVRSRMSKTGESYTAARAQILRKKEEPKPDYAALAGMSEDALRRKTGRTWAEWVCILDDFGAATKPHPQIARHAHQQGAPDWWAQSVAVGYERIRGLRQVGQRRSGQWEANKSRTFDVPVKKVFEAFTSAAKRRRWLDEKLTIRKATPPKYIYITWPDGTNVTVGFTVKSDSKTSVAVQHAKLGSKEDAARLKDFWSARFDALGDLLSVRKASAARG